MPIYPILSNKLPIIILIYPKILVNGYGFRMVTRKKWMIRVPGLDNIPEPNPNPKPEKNECQRLTNRELYKSINQSTSHQSRNKKKIAFCLFVLARILFPISIESQRIEMTSNKKISLFWLNFKLHSKRSVEKVMRSLNSKLCQRQRKLMTHNIRSDDDDDD